MQEDLSKTTVILRVKKQRVPVLSWRGLAIVQKDP